MLAWETQACREDQGQGVLALGTEPVAEFEDGGKCGRGHGRQTDVPIFVAIAATWSRYARIASRGMLVVARGPITLLKRVCDEPRMGLLGLRATQPSPRSRIGAPKRCTADAGAGCFEKCLDDQVQAGSRREADLIGLVGFAGHDEQ